MLSAFAGSVLVVLVAESSREAAVSFAGPGRLERQPGVTVAVAGLTTMAPVLMKGRGLRDVWGTGFSSVFSIAFDSGCFAAAGGDECSLTDTDRGGKVLVSSHLALLS